MGEQLTVRMPEELAAKLEEAAKILRRSRSDVVRLALSASFTKSWKKVKRPCLHGR